MFQWFYNFFRSLKYPAWMKQFIQDLNDLMLQVIKQAGQAYINYLKEKIIEAAKNDKLTVGQKFDWVVRQAKSGFSEFSVELKDNEINTLVNYLVSLLKRQEFI